MQDDTARTEEATPERRRKAREDGQFPRAREAGTALGSALIVALAFSVGPQMGGILWRFARHSFANLGAPFQMSLAPFVTTLAILVLPFALVATGSGLAMGFAQAGFQPRLELAMPRLDRLDPVKKLGSMLSFRNAATEIGFALGRVLILGFVTYVTLQGLYGDVTKLAKSPLPAAMMVMLGLIGKLTVRVVAVLCVMALLDYVSSWFQIAKSLRMTKQEVKEEHRRNEGDPRIKMKVRARARERIKRALYRQVKAADVIVTNPTHVSVALRYRPQEGAPIVVAKGYDEIALFIRELAREAEIPIVESPPLARRLAKTVKVGRAIPVDVYAAVAEILAFVYRIKNRGTGAAERSR